ncbi:MAG TPA: hypothetical protein VM120_00645 [Bryobacteraceae bacterium]|nr:hypothetical protein [Bryobacteraceae bacterium]
MRLCLVVVLMTLLPAIAFSQAAKIAKWTILPLAHPDAKLLIGVDWRRIMDSALGPMVLKQIQKGGHPLLGFLESIENVDRLLVSSPGGGDGRAPLLVVGEGRFALAKVRAMAKSDGAVSRKYNDVELLVSPDATNADLHFALLDAQTILFGDGASVKSAIDRSQRGEATNDRNPLFFRAVTLSTVQDVWAVVREPADSLGSLGIPPSSLSEQLETMELGLSMAQTLNATLTIKAATNEAAEMLATGLPALLQLAALTYSHQPSLAQLARRLKVVSERNFVKMGFTIDGKLLEQSLNEIRASTAPAPAESQLIAPPERIPERGSLTATKGPIPEGSRPPVNGARVVRIVGMDEGIREIPYDARKPN